MLSSTQFKKTMEKLLEEIKNTQLHSTRAILIGTFLGGPLAAGYLMMENYQNLDRKESANKALLYGIGGTILLFTLIFLIPDSIMTMIPSPVIPIASMAAVYAIVESQLGETLKIHQAKDRVFYSRWRALVVGLISLAIISITIFTAIFVFIDLE